MIINIQQSKDMCVASFLSKRFKSTKQSKNKKGALRYFVYRYSETFCTTLWIPFQGKLIIVIVNCEF